MGPCSSESRVGSERGQGGGFLLTPSLDDLTMLDVGRAIASPSRSWPAWWSGRCALRCDGRRKQDVVLPVDVGVQIPLKLSEAAEQSAVGIAGIGRRQL